jgi:hypothetical protein
MALSTVGTVTTFASSGVVTQVTNSVPTGVLNNDMLIWSFGGPSATVPVGVPTGWLTLNVSSTTALYVANYYRFASSEPASYSSDNTLVSTRHAGVMQAIRGVDMANPFDAAPANGRAGTTTTTTAAITPTSFGAWVLGLLGQTFASGVTPGTLSSTNLTLDASPSTNVAATINVLIGAGHFAWTSGAFTPNASNSAATTRTMFQRTVIRPAILPRPSSLVVPPNQTMQSFTR